MTLYALKYRPPSFCTLPRGLRWDYVHAPAGGLPRRPELTVIEKYPHGVISTERELTADEMYDYEIVQVN